MENIEYEEYFLLKGCNRVHNYQDYKDEQEKRRQSEGAGAEAGKKNGQAGAQEGAKY